jgi:hypothetical protein
VVDDTLYPQVTTKNVVEILKNGKDAQREKGSETEKA